jgi:hypothetical protein
VSGPVRKGLGGFREEYAALRDEAEGLKAEIAEFSSRTDLEQRYASLSGESAALASNIEALSEQEHLSTEQKEQLKVWREELGGVNSALGGVAGQQSELEGLQSALGEVTAKMTELREEAQEAMKAVVFDLMKARLETDGWTEAEVDLATEVARSMGLIDDDTAKASEAMNAALTRFAEGQGVTETRYQIQGIATDLAKIPTNIDVSVNITPPDWSGVPGGGRHGMEQQQAGTTFARGGTAIVGEFGPELIDLPRGSRVMPAYHTRTMLNSNNTVTNNRGGDTVMINDTKALALYNRQRQRDSLNNMRRTM